MSLLCMEWKVWMKTNIQKFKRHHGLYTTGQEKTSIMKLDVPWYLFLIDIKIISKSKVSSLVVIIRFYATGIWIKDRNVAFSYPCSILFLLLWYSSSYLSTLVFSYIFDFNTVPCLIKLYGILIEMTIYRKRLDDKRRNKIHVGQVKGQWNCRYHWYMYIVWVNIYMTYMYIANIFPNEKYFYRILL